MTNLLIILMFIAAVVCCYGACLNMKRGQKGIAALNGVASVMALTYALVSLFL